MQTVADKLASAAAARAEREAKEQLEAQILGELPPALPCPGVSNESPRAFFGKPGAWVSFYRHYGEDWRSSDVLAQFEAGGFQPLAVTLCKWDNYRMTAEPGAQDELPDTKGRYKLTDSVPLAPLWVVPEQHTGTHSSCYYRSPAGLILKVAVPGPALASIHARRRERPGDWWYESGTGKLHFPQSWHDALRAEDGQSVATVAAQSRAYVDTQQGLSGAIYFAPHVEQAAFPLTPSAMLAILENAKV